MLKAKETLQIKESLLVAIAEIEFKQLNRALQGALVSNTDNHKERLEAISVAYIQYAIIHQTYYRVIKSDRQLICAKYPELERISQTTFAVLLDVIKAGQEAQVFISEDAMQLARVCWSMTHGLSMLAIDNQFTMSDSDDLLKLARIATNTVSKGLIIDL